MVNIRTVSSAFKHGIHPDDIKCAFNNIVFDHPFEDEPEKNLLIGFDRSLNLLEIMYNEIEEDTVKVFHAMKCRPAWYELAEGGEEE